MHRIERLSPIVRWTRRLEEASALDGPVHAIEHTIDSGFGAGPRGSVLRGEWLGHALHPVLTDLVIGTWTSATVLDLAGGPGSAPAAQRLVGTGLLAVGPTAWTGWAEWSVAQPREKRVGLVHAVVNAVVNAVAIGSYAASWNARRRGNHDTGAKLALAGAAASGLGAYLGGHLAIARKVGSRNPAFAD